MRRCNASLRHTIWPSSPDADRGSWGDILGLRWVDAAPVLCGFGWLHDEVSFEETDRNFVQSCEPF